MNDQEQQTDEKPVHQLQPQRDPDETWSVPIDDLDATWPVAHKAEQRAD